MTFSTFSKLKKPEAYWSYKVYEKTDGGIKLINKVGPVKNVVVENYEVVACGMLLGSGVFNGGVKYAEVGTGDVGWGVTPPAPSISTTALTAPLTRRLPFSKSFVDLVTLEPTDTQTSRIRISFMLNFFEPDVDGQIIREYALFGGDASSTLSTGHMINVIRPTPLPKEAFFRIVYEVDFLF